MDKENIIAKLEAYKEKAPLKGAFCYLARWNSEELDHCGQFSAFATL